MKRKRMVVCSVAAAKQIIAGSVNNADALASADAWNKVAVVGKWKGHNAGPFELTLPDLEQMVTNFNNATAIEVVADYEHATLSGNPAPAAGWVKELKVEDNALYARIDWLDDAKELIKAKKYKYLSPVLVPHMVDQVTGDDIGWALHSVALTNKPFFEELDAVQAKKETQVQTKEEKVLDEKTKAEIEKLKKEKQDLEDENATLKAAKAEAKIDEAITAKKIHPDQKESLLAFSKNDPDGFEKFLAAAKPIATAPAGNNIFAGSQNNGAGNAPQYDVLKLGGFNNG